MRISDWSSDVCSSDLQSGYELMVAYSLRDLRKGKGEVWSTGKVHSSQSVHLAYDGKPLQSFTRYYWRVRVYDMDGKASAWSATQRFETAALTFGECAAEWHSDGRSEDR